MASPEPVDLGEPPTEAETHPQEEQESERRMQAIIEDLNGFDREFAALSNFDRAIQSMQVSLSEGIKDMICRLVIVHHCDSDSGLDIAKLGNELVRALTDTLRAPNDTSRAPFPYGEDNAVDALICCPLYKFLTPMYIAARDGLGDSRSSVSSVLASLAQHPFGKDDDHARELIRIDIEGYEASLVAFRRDAAKCTANTFKSIRRRVAFLRGWLDQIQGQAKEKCDGSRLQSACDGLNRDQQRAFIIGVAETICEPPFANEPMAV